MDYRENEKPKHLLARITEFAKMNLIPGASALGGTTLGFYNTNTGMDPQSAAMIGIGASQIFRFGLNTMNDAISQMLSNKQKARVGTALFHALEVIHERLEVGDAPRDDLSGESAEELFDGSLIVSRDTYEKKKLKHLGFFIGNIPFEKDIAPSTAHNLLRQAEAMSYRQFCLMELLSGKHTTKIGRKMFPTRISGYSGAGHNPHYDAFMEELDWILDRRLVGQRKNASPRHMDQLLMHSVLSDSGELFYRLLGLNKIEEIDLEYFVEEVNKFLQDASN
ncbi:MAG: hypothetical protein P1V97_36550 [Planctomycetota bacterium]|nr:hypothetical protein [Planctomycetota bacterium]